MYPQWTRARRDNAAWGFGQRLPGIKEAAQAKTDGPKAAYRKPDFWGNVKQSRVDPGMLVNRKTKPWYPDDPMASNRPFVTGQSTP